MRTLYFKIILIIFYITSSTTTALYTLIMSLFFFKTRAKYTKYINKIIQRLSNTRL